MSVDLIINFFCEFKGITRAQLLSYYKGTNESSTRYMLWHYLHTAHKVSAGNLSKMFNRNVPSIFRGIRVVKHHMELYDDVRKEYDIIVKELESMDLSTPSD